MPLKKIISWLYVSKIPLKEFHKHFMHILFHLNSTTYWNNAILKMEKVRSEPPLFSSNTYLVPTVGQTLEYVLLL
jgi:hypothetical protein